jgi:hypothetical protein
VFVANKGQEERHRTPARAASVGQTLTVLFVAGLARTDRGDGVQEAREFWPGQVVVVVHVEAVEELQSGRSTTAQ